MASMTMYPADERLAGGERLVFNLYIISAVALFALMMLIGLSMRMSQATWLVVPPDWFYRLLTIHGSGMVGTCVMAATAVMWFFLRKYVRLHLWAFATNYVLFLLGALCIIASVFIGGYAGLWTFLYPLPSHGMGMWSPLAAALFMLGYLLIGVGELIFYLDAAAGIIKVYGNFGRALGWHWLFGGTVDPNHPKAVVASTSMIIANTLGILAGAIVLIMCLVHIFFGVNLDALLVKALIFWFGHMYINAAIYMGVIAIYELLPRYTGKPYPLTRTFLWSWASTTVFVTVVFGHHLLMDYAVPHWFLVLGQITSWTSGFPVFLVTAWGGLSNIYQANMQQWKMPARLMILSLFGWVAGGFCAILDSTMRFNLVMHNTQWVPGHFHSYLLIGVLAMVLALMYHVIGERQQKLSDSGGDRAVFQIYVGGALIFLFAFLDAGRLSVPRRMATHLPAWLFTDELGSIGGILVVLAMLYFAIRITVGLLQASSNGETGVGTADTAG